jgi:hypothetical protein
MTRIIATKAVLVAFAVALFAGGGTVLAAQTNAVTSSGRSITQGGSFPVLLSNICAPSYKPTVPAPPPPCYLAKYYPIGTPFMCGPRKGTIVR